MLTLDLLPTAIQTDIEHVEVIVQERIAARETILRLVQGYLAEVQGRKLRAALTLLSAQLGTYELVRVQHAAAAVELIYLASLVHDDLVDERARRRGRAAAQQPWEHTVELMLGDYFFALAAGEMSRSPDARVISYFSHAVMKICEGVLMPVTEAAPFDDARSQYYARITSKTASLFAAACKAGSALGGGSEDQIEHMGTFGYQLGLAYQVAADVHDYHGNPPAGRALRRGTITLPLLYAVAHGDAARLLAALDSSDGRERAWALAEVQRVGLAPARAEVHEHLATARQQLAACPDTPARQTLGQLADAVPDAQSAG